MKSGRNQEAVRTANLILGSKNNAGLKATDLESLGQNNDRTADNDLRSVKSEYDYRFESEYRNEIFEAIKYVCWKRNKVNLPVYGVPDKLKDFHTSKRDISEGNEIDPEERFRIKSEDVYPEDPTAGTGAGL